jgi:hypothetical protein
MCHLNNIEFMKWFHNIYKIDIHYMDDEYFLRICSFGHLEIAKWIYSFGGFSDIILTRAFITSKHIEISQWLFSLERIEINESIFKWAFNFACSNNKFELAKWINSINSDYKFDIHSKNIDKFINLCLEGNLEFAKWIYSFGGINICLISDKIISNIKYQKDKHHIINWIQDVESQESFLNHIIGFIKKPFI